LIRRKLLNPATEVLDSCRPHLRTAIDSLENLQQLLAASTSRPGPARTALQTEVSELGRELRQVNSLMRNASAFYSGLGRLLTPDNDGTMAYAPSGPLTIRRASTLQLEG